MANELGHITADRAAAGAVTQTEFDSITAHRFSSQATGDTLYASSATQLSRLAVGSAGQILSVAAGIPAWLTTLVGAYTFSGAITFSNALTLVKNSAAASSELRIDTSGVDLDARLTLYENGVDKWIVRNDGDAADVMIITSGSVTLMTLAQAGGFIVGAPTGGNQGAGTINAVGVYDDGVLLTCFPFDAAYDGRVDIAKWDALVPDRVIPAFTKRDALDREVIITPEQRVKRQHDGARSFDPRVLDPEYYSAYLARERHLPALPGPLDAGKLYSMGAMQNRMVESLDVLAILVAKLHERLKAIGA